MVILESDFEIIKFESIDSTNEEAKRLIKKNGICNPSVIISATQTAGNGRYGNQWLSASDNLYCSLVKKVDIDLYEAAKYSFLTAVAVGETIAGLVSGAPEINYKWPNDILLNKKKVSGILLESLRDSKGSVWIVIGIGVNLNSTPRDGKMQVTSIFETGVSEVDVDDFLKKLLVNFKSQENVWKNQGFSCIRAAWLKHAYKLEEEIRVNLPKKTFRGKFEGLSQNGELEVLVGDKKLLVSSGEVFFE